MIAGSTSLAAQEQDVRVGIRGYVDEKINIAIDDVTPTSSAAQTVANILAFDLDFSLRFNVISGRAQAGVVRTAGSVDYEAWSIFGTRYLVKASLNPSSAGFAADIELHNVPFQQQIRTLSYALPDLGSPNFRMTVHEISNEIIREFASRRRGDKEIFVTDYDGQNPYRVTRLDTISMTPDWSADGADICFTTFVRGNADLYCAASSGGRARPLSDRKGLNIAPAWSPDGRRMALTLTKDGNAELYVLDVGRRSLRRLTYNLGIDTAPSWSQNGRRIVFESDRGGRSQIFVMDAEGANLKQLAFGNEAHSPEWSPQGDRIAYVERISGRFQIVTIGVNGDGRTVLTSTGDNEDPSWSPDGQRRSFLVSRRFAHRILVDAEWPIGHLHYGLERPAHSASDSRRRVS
jgi:TolB protein